MTWPTELPAATPQNPACGACNGETRFDGDSFVCEACRLSFDPDDDLAASFLDADAEPCGSACSNFWHGANKVKQGLSYECGVCQLPVGHESLHWTGCRPRMGAPDGSGPAH